MDLLWNVAISPDYPIDQTIFVAGNNGVYKSTDGGTSWIVVNNGLPSGSQMALAISPNFLNDQTIFVCGSYGLNNGIYKSIDGGDSWYGVSSSSPDESHNAVSEMVISKFMKTIKQFLRVRILGISIVPMMAATVGRP